MGEDVRFNLNVYQHVNAVLLVKSCYYVYISGRVDSAMGQYNPNRMNYQLEELGKVDQLMTSWNIHDDQFIDQIKARILMSNIQNISKQKMSLSKKRHYIEVLCRNQEMIALLNKATSPLHPLVRRLFHFRMYLTVIFLKKLQTLIK